MVVELLVAVRVGVGAHLLSVLDCAPGCSNMTFKCVLFLSVVKCVKFCLIAENSAADFCGPPVVFSISLLADTDRNPHGVRCPATSAANGGDRGAWPSGRTTKGEVVYLE